MILFLIFSIIFNQIKNKEKEQEKYLNYVLIVQNWMKKKIRTFVIISIRIIWRKDNNNKTKIMDHSMIRRRDSVDTQQRLSLQNLMLIQSTVMNKIIEVPKGNCPLQQLGIKHKKQNHQDYLQLRYILRQLLSYPSTQISQLHMDANRLGFLDLKYHNQNSNSQQFRRMIKDSQACPCCGFIRQSQTLSICTEIQQINHIGISTYLYFMTLKILIVFLIVMFIFYSIYALASNVQASEQYRNFIGNNVVQKDLQSYTGLLSISLGSKQIHQTISDKNSYDTQCWLGVTMLIIWGVLFLFVKKKQRQVGLEIEKNAITAKDFTVLIKNFPKNMKIEELQSIIEQYCKEHIVDINCRQYSIKPKIMKINAAVPFYLQHSFFKDKGLQQINSKYNSYKEIFISWVKDRIKNENFTISKEERQKIMDQYEQIKQKRAEQYRKVVKQIKMQLNISENQETVPAFVTFNSSLLKKYFIHVHQKSHQILNYLKCQNREEKYLQFKSNSNQKCYTAKIRSATQPQDIIWMNLGQNFQVRLKKMLFTYSITFLVLLVSFGAISGLSKIQTELLQNKEQKSYNFYLSILISLVISIINIVLQLILRLLTQIQRIPTRTGHQISLGIKAVCALLINSILIPILICYFFKQNLYGINGLAEDVFYLGLTNSLLSPALKIVDPSYFFSRFYKWYKTQPLKKLRMNQNQLNATAQLMEFQVGYQYIYMVNLFLFTCFFASLQPIIVIFAITGLLLMYWSQKYSLFHRCQRPTPGNDSINTAMYQLIYMGPGIYTLGSFCWSHFFKTQFIGIASNLTAAVISAIILIFPYQTLTNLFFEVSQVQELTYEKSRVFLPSQYDRLNPATSKNAINQYRSFLVQKRKEFQHATQAQMQEIERKINNLYGIGNNRTSEQIFDNSNDILNFRNSLAYTDNNILMQEVLGSNNNTTNPFFLANTVLLNTSHHINVGVQNWAQERSQIDILSGIDDDDSIMQKAYSELQQGQYEIQNEDNIEQQQRNKTLEIQDNRQQLMKSTKQFLTSSMKLRQTTKTIPINMFGNLFTVNQQAIFQAQPNQIKQLRINMMKQEQDKKMLRIQKNIRKSAPMDLSYKREQPKIYYKNQNTLDEIKIDLDKQNKQTHQKDKKKGNQENSQILFSHVYYNPNKKLINNNVISSQNIPNSSPTTHRIDHEKINYYQHQTDRNVYTITINKNDGNTQNSQKTVAEINIIQKQSPETFMTSSKQPILKSNTKEEEQQIIEQKEQREEEYKVSISGPKEVKKKYIIQFQPSQQL